MRLPAEGALGSMSVAGASVRLETTAAHVANSVTPTPSPPEARAMGMLTGMGKEWMGTA